MLLGSSLRPRSRDADALRFLWMGPDAPPRLRASCIGLAAGRADPAVALLWPDVKTQPRLAAVCSALGAIAAGRQSQCVGCSLKAVLGEDVFVGAAVASPGGRKQEPRNPGAANARQRAGLDEVERQGESSLQAQGHGRCGSGHGGTVPTHVAEVGEVRKTSVGQEVLAPSQDSGMSQGLALARQIVPAGSLPSTGHAAEDPVQCSTASQTPAAARQTVELERKMSAGHAFEAPSQTSAESQTPAAARQTVPEGILPSAGQDADTPLQVSATSHGPAAARQTVPLADSASAGQLFDTPSQCSAGSQAPTENRQMCVASSLTSAGQPALVPVQWSARSHAPADARHTVELAAKPVPTQLPAPSHWSPVVQTSLSLQAVPESAGRHSQVPVSQNTTAHCPHFGADPAQPNFSQ